MTSLKPSIESVGLKIGLITSLSLLAYFFIMKALGLSQIIELRIFNFLILGTGICYGIYKLKKELHEENFYLKGLVEGLFISLVALVPFATIIAFYLEYVDIGLMNHIKSGLASGEYINGFTIFVVIFMEGIASGAIITYCAMQYFKSVWSEKEQKWV